MAISKVAVLGTGTREEGVATPEDIATAMTTGAGSVPPPFARAEAQGLESVLAALERAQAEWGDAYAPPATLRHLVAEGGRFLESPG